MERLRILNSYQIFKIKKKNLKHIAVDVLLKGFPMNNDATLMQCRSNLAGRQCCGTVTIYYGSGSGYDF
jgi:hypothetical protein